MSENDKSDREIEPEVPLRGTDWERQFTVEENRVSEYVELYESIGYEVRVEPATPDETEDCQVCFKADFGKLRTIYIKQKSSQDNELNLNELV